MGSTSGVMPESDIKKLFPSKSDPIPFLSVDVEHLDLLRDLGTETFASYVEDAWGLRPSLRPFDTKGGPSANSPAPVG